MARQYAIGGPLGGGYVIDGEDRDFAIAQTYVSKQAVPTADAWSFADKSATVTLSASDKLATINTSTNSGVRSTQTNLNGSAGKYYAEFSIVNIGAPTRIGITPTSNTLIAQTANIFAISNNGNIAVNGLVAGNVGSTFTDGDVVCIAWDTGSERVWLRKNSGLWNNDASADPAAGTNGLDSSFAPSTAHALWFNASSLNDATTIRTELAEYTQAVPSGFTSWMGEAPVGDVGVTVNVTGQATTAAVGEVSVTVVSSVAVNVAGQAVTSAVGDPSVTGKSRVILTGQAVTSAVGPLALIVTHANFTVTAPEMLASTQGVGVEAGGSISTTASGSEITSGVGQVSVRADHKFSVTGQQVTGSVGEVAVTAKSNVSTIPVGQATTAGVGQVTIDARSSVSTTATGQQVTSAVGEVSVSTVVRIDDLVTPAGQEITSAVGTLTVTGKANVSTIPTGQAVTTGVGTPTVTGSSGVSVLVAGQEIVSAVGVPSITTHARFTVTGQEVTSAVGQTGVTSGTGVTVLAGVGGGAITPPAYRPHTLTSYAARADTIMDKPATTAENDILIAALVRVTSVTGGHADVVPPAGFTKIGTTTSVNDFPGNNGKLELFWKRATASEPATYTFGQWASASTQGLMVAYSGCPTSGDPIDVYSQNAQGNPGMVATATALSVTTTQAQDNLLWIGHNWDASTTLTPPSGMTERADSLLYFSEQAITAAGATGNRTQTQATTSPWAVYLLALKGASGAGAGLSGLVASVSPPSAVTGTGNVLLAGQEVIASGRGVGVSAGGSISTTVSSGLATTSVGQVGVNTTHRFSITGTQADTAVGQVTVDARQTVSTTVVGQSLAVALSPVTVTAGSRVSVPLAGQAVASAVGAVNFSLAISALVPVSSEELSAGVGAIYFPIGIDDSVTLDGQAVQAEVGAVTVTTVALRGMDVWTGTSWAGKPAKVWTGSAWVPKPVKLWNGSSWI